jgi:hypothetical protein
MKTHQGNYSIVHQEMNMNNQQGKYSTKLKDPRWQKKRLQILERDEFTCQNCLDSESTLHVHHKAYIQDRDPWDYPDTLLVTLCEGCHERESKEIKISKQQLFLALSDSGALAANFDDIKEAFMCTSFREEPLDEVEWTVLGFAIKEILDSRLGDRELWNTFEKAYFKYLEKRGGEIQ